MVFTTSALRGRYEELLREGDVRLPAGVRFVFVPEPTVEEAVGWVDVMQCYSARVFDCLREVYGDAPPDLIEFPEFLAEGFVTVQAAQARDPFLKRTRIAVRVHTSAEITDVLDGHLRSDPNWQAVFAMERFALANADRLVWQGGDVLRTYERFYGKHRLAPAIRIRHPFVAPLLDGVGEPPLGARRAEPSGAVERGTSNSPPATDRGAATGVLRVLYAGRFERRKGVQNLVWGACGSDRDDFRLTLVGGDTLTGPLGVSVREQLLLAVGDDERFVVGGALSRGALAGLIGEHDVVVVPSLWECWPYAALEALHLNRPVLGTPVGGLVELVRPGVSGWLAKGTDSVALGEAFEELLECGAQARELVAEGVPRDHARALSDEREILDGYEALMGVELERSVQRRGSRRELPLVSAIVPYFRASRFVGEAVASLVSQSYPRLEIVLVNDGSFEDEDWVVAEIAGRLPVVVVSQINAGLGAARNFGISQSRGRYFFPLDADNVAEPEFVARCVEVLESQPEVAYVTSWSRYMDTDGTLREGPEVGYQPLGNHAALNAEQNVAGDAAALLRRSLFDGGFRYSEELTSFEDWHLYRRLQRAGHFGVVIPERLLRYRVRADSMQAQIAQPNRDRLLSEIDALIRENETQWTSPNVTSPGSG